MEEDSRVIYIEIPTSKTPSTPSPCRERRIGFFDLITRRFGRRSHDDLNCYQNHHGDEDSRSSSTDSCSSTSDRLTITTTKTHCSNLEISCSSDSSSNSSSSNNSSGNDNNQNSARRHHRRSTSSLRKALQSLSISPRSLSCSGGDLDNNVKESSTKQQKKIKKQQAPKRILRQPVTYTYLKGISGLPTQRVPKSSVCCHHMRR